MNAPVRLKEIASSLGLSVPTVSLALRNAGNISADTCARVQQAAAAMGYRPNLYAAALSTGWHARSAQQMPLAIVRWSSREGARYPILQIVQGIEKRGAELGYHIETCNLSSSRELPRCLRLLYNQGIQGIFLAPVGEDPEAFNQDWSRFCVLACGRYHLPSPFHVVRPEIFESTRALVSKAKERGYSRIGAALFHHDPPLIDDFARLSAIRVGVMSALPRCGACEVLLSQPGGDERLSKWVRQKHLDAVMLFSVGQYHTLVDEKIKVPEEVGVATLHYWDDLHSRHISGMLQQYAEIGAASVNHMDYMIRHHERGLPHVPQHIVIASKWMEGTTLPVKASPLRSSGSNRPGKSRLKEK